VFFSPNDTDHNGVPGVTVADEGYLEREWATGGCSTTIGSRIPSSVNTIAGWSLGRLGPLYFLAANPARWSEIHTVILFDPGNQSEMASSCDGSAGLNVNALLVKWLKASPVNQLILLTGFVSEEHTIQLPGNVGLGESHYHGLWDYYLKGLWLQAWSVRSRARVCDYNNLGHADVLRDLYSVVKQSGAGARPSTCPTSAAAHPPELWNP
jgi:hypothetical protein